MLNALFGNPNLHLVQLHKDFGEISNFIEDERKYGDKYLDADNYEIQKKRRNAV